MPDQISSRIFTQNLFALLREVFEKSEGIFLDRGTALPETLALLPAAEASRPLREPGTTIASHVYHLLFYLRVLRDYMDGRGPEKIDWNASWSRRVVNDDEWDSLRRDVTKEYAQLAADLEKFDDWDDDRHLGEAIAIIAHTAYHLGAIRQMMLAIRD